MIPTLAIVRSAALAAILCGFVGSPAVAEKPSIATKALAGTDLKGADIKGADLVGADLRGADLVGADLRGADLPAPSSMGRG